MTTNEIEKQLKSKAIAQIREHAEKVVDEMRSFGIHNTDLNRNGVQWYHKRVKPQSRFDGEEIKDPWNHFDWDELKQLIVRNMKETFLESMVEKKTKELLNKIDLFE
tara:strand:+ start:2379 stop:2699 length:321 start_codon:yes stop_codon:yes gene_type:complete